MSESPVVPSGPPPSTGSGQVQPAPGDHSKKRIQVSLGFISFQCWKIDNAWRRLDAATKKAHVEEFVAACEKARGGLMHFASFSTAALKADVDFMVWGKAKTLDALHGLGLAQRATELSKWLTPSHNYLAMLKGSPYESEDKIFRPEEFYKFLFIYPFVKTRPWYNLPLEERMRIMRGPHREVGPLPHGQDQHQLQLRHRRPGLCGGL